MECLVLNKKVNDRTNELTKKRKKERTKGGTNEIFSLSARLIASELASSGFLSPTCVILQLHHVNVASRRRK
jgi:hypothetical protein